MRFKIIHGFNLKAGGGTLMQPGAHFETEDADKLKELRDVFCKNGSCEELVSKPKTETKPEVPADPGQDLSTVPGVGKAVLEKLTAKGITTVEQLKAFVADTTKEAEVKELFGTHLKKVQAHFSK